MSFPTGFGTGKSALLIGNSLTTTVQPWLLDNGPFPLADENFHTCGSASTQTFIDDPFCNLTPPQMNYEQLLAANSYDFLVVQIHRGTTFTQDVNNILAFLALQPTIPNLVIYTGWPPWEDVCSDYEAGYSGGATGNMIHTPEYFDQLLDELRVQLPTKNICLNDAISLMYKLAKDPELPFDSFGDLFMDNIHTTFDGSYMAHNLMRRTLGLGRPYNPFASTNQAAIPYMDNCVETFDAATNPPSGISICLNYNAGV